MSPPFRSAQHRSIAITASALFLLAACADPVATPDPGLPAAAMGADAGKWTSRAPMPTPRTMAVAVSAPDASGRAVIYVFGGYANNLETDAVETYDPVSDSWTILPPMPEPLFSICGANLLNGKIYLVGGWRRMDEDPHYTTLEYTIATGTWRSIRMMHGYGDGISGVIGGKLYALDGNDGYGQGWLDMYDPATDAWTMVQRGFAVHQHGAGAVLGNRLYVSGGWRNFTTDPDWATRLNQAFDPQLERPTDLAPMAGPRYGHSVAAVNHRLYNFGGYYTSALSRVDIYNPANNRWVAGAPMPEAMGAMAVATYREASGRTVVYLIGGSTGGLFGPGVVRNLRFDPGTAE
jgi:N-acetylneuraminic acid mutarotase